MTYKTRLERATIRPSAADSLMAATLADERRWANRRSSTLPGLVISDRLQASVACVVRDLSATGAQINLKITSASLISNADGLPQTLVLFLIRENAEVNCEIAWRRGNSAGVRFLSAIRTLPPRPVAKPVKKK